MWTIEPIGYGEVAGKKGEASDKAQTQRVDWASASWQVRIHDSMTQDLVTLCQFISS